MMSRFEKSVRRLQERYGDALLTSLTVILLLLMFVVAPLRAEDVVIAQLIGAVLLFGLMVIALAVSGNMISFGLMLVALTMNGAAVIRRADHQSTANMELVAGAWLILALTLGWIVARAVFAPGRVSYHRVVGAVLLYLLIAVIFGALFTFVGLFVANAFSGLALVDSPALASNLIYFSLVTLTSTGYGDVVPVSPIARSLCNLETIIGQLYPATLLARLVTLELAHRP
ncbi:MAG TPA: ion channel [Xanthobacteraceae bacterium]|nr:ion channel [Xanthobacteraceae bacterium]